VCVCVSPFPLLSPAEMTRIPPAKTSFPGPLNHSLSAVFVPGRERERDMPQAKKDLARPSWLSRLEAQTFCRSLANFPALIAASREWGGRVSRIMLARPGLLHWTRLLLQPRPERDCVWVHVGIWVHVPPWVCVCVCMCVCGWVVCRCEVPIPRRKRPPELTRRLRSCFSLALNPPPSLVDPLGAVPLSGRRGAPLPSWSVSWEIGKSTSPGARLPPNHLGRSHRHYASPPPPLQSAKVRLATAVWLAWGMGRAPRSIRVCTTSAGQAMGQTTPARTAAYSLGDALGRGRSPSLAFSTT